MRVLVVFNPIAGAGRAAAEAERIVRALREAGHDAVEHASERGDAVHWLDPLLAGRELLVIVGGDGAVRSACASASRCNVPLYQVPSGTENLFAREMGMNRSTATLLRAIEHRSVERIDLGEADGHPFVLMASLGFDARVVADLSARRNGSITHWSYAGPFIRQLGGWKAAGMTIRVDGERIDRNRPGFVVVANCRQYGWRLNPASRAIMNDGRLDVVFFPCASRLELLKWIINCRRQCHLNDGKATYRTGVRVEIECEREEPIQVDGDLLEGSALTSPRRSTRVEIVVRRAALPVLLPAACPP